METLDKERLLAQIDALDAEKRALEGNIRRAIDAELQHFQETTGLMPASIDIRMLETTTCRDTHPNFELGPVHVELNIAKARPF